MPEQASLKRYIHCYFCYFIFLVYRFFGFFWVLLCLFVPLSTDTVPGVERAAEKLGTVRVGDGGLCVFIIIMYMTMAAVPSTPEIRFHVFFPGGGLQIGCAYQSANGSK